jgi:hypothetical protein
MRGPRERAEIEAIQALQDWAVFAPRDELLPLLAASVLCAGAGADAGVFRLLSEVARALCRAGHLTAAARLLSAAAAWCARQGAAELAADLAEETQLLYLERRAA